MATEEAPKLGAGGPSARNLQGDTPAEASIKTTSNAVLKNTRGEKGLRTTSNVKQAVQPAEEEALLTTSNVKQGKKASTGSKDSVGTK